MGLVQLVEPASCWCKFWGPKIVIQLQAFTRSGSLGEGGGQEDSLKILGDSDLSILIQFYVIETMNRFFFLQYNSQDYLISLTHSLRFCAFLPESHEILPASFAPGLFTGINCNSLLLKVFYCFVCCCLGV